MMLGLIPSTGRYNQSLRFVIKGASKQYDLNTVMSEEDQGDILKMEQVFCVPLPITNGNSFLIRLRFIRNKSLISASFFRGCVFFSRKVRKSKLV